MTREFQLAASLMLRLCSPLPAPLRSFLLRRRKTLAPNARTVLRTASSLGIPCAAQNQQINRVPYFFDTGLVMYGPTRSRPRDFAGFALIYGSYSRDLRQAEEIQPTSIGVQHFETTMELNYGWTIKRGLLLQPDLQYVVHPNGNRRLPDAVAIGINIVVNM